MSYKAQGDAFNTYACILLLKMRKKKGSLSIVSFVDKVNSPFAPNVELFGSDVWWEDVVSALSQNRFICLNVASHTPSSEMLILHSIE